MRYVVLHKGKIIGNTVELQDLLSPNDFIIFEGYREVLTVNRIADHPNHRMIRVGDVIEDSKS